ncbi:hypothetical protein MUK42_33214 [Musa troglodytarum]|uniref:Uncharacterized protein n=1 Tax=Musa troglodytarum TaxID=320322 RepID=A0A9E7FSL9_9LILI|nr:hypothetical protein MUK42_33214 [Musa troglodytarum]
MPPSVLLLAGSLVLKALFDELVDMVDGTTKPHKKRKQSMVSEGEKATTARQTHLNEVGCSTQVVGSGQNPAEHFMEMPAVILLSVTLKWLLR